MRNILYIQYRNKEKLYFNEKKEIIQYNILFGYWHNPEI